MSHNILYYSNYCDNCKRLLQILSKSQIKEELHFICIDKRVTMPDGSVQILMKDGSQVLLPPTVTKVPAMLLVNNGFHVLYGDQIYQHLQPKKIYANKATNNKVNQMRSVLIPFLQVVLHPINIVSDMNADDLLAKGNGERQMFNCDCSR